MFAKLKHRLGNLLSDCKLNACCCLCTKCRINTCERQALDVVDHVEDDLLEVFAHSLALGKKYWKPRQAWRKHKQYAYPFKRKICCEARSCSHKL